MQYEKAWKMNIIGNIIAFNRQPSDINYEKFVNFKSFFYDNFFFCKIKILFSALGVGFGVNLEERGGVQLI